MRDVNDNDIHINDLNNIDLCISDLSMKQRLIIVRILQPYARTVCDDPWELGMQMHQVDVEPLLEKMGIDYDPAAKYLGRHGKFIGKPAPSAVNCGVQDMIYNIKAQ